MAADISSLPPPSRPAVLAPLAPPPGAAPFAALPGSPPGALPPAGTPRASPRGGEAGPSSRRQPNFADASDGGKHARVPLIGAPSSGDLAGASQLPAIGASSSSSVSRKSSTQTQAAYKRIAQERCTEAMAKAQQIAKHRARHGLPPGVWWGFHWFWPPELLKPKPNDPLEDPDFLRKVFRLMNDETVVDTFAIFDQDGSGTISSKELEGLVQMLVPNPSPTIVSEMIRELDMDSDGEIDLWEFCVHMQKRTEGMTKADIDAELDYAFGLFEPGPDGCLDEAELRRVLQNPHTGAALEEAELQDMLAELNASGCGPAQNGGRIPFRKLRHHQCFQPPTDGMAAPPGSLAS
jgi:calmodulin